MSDTVFTMPGKLGDAIMQWPVAYQWAKAKGQTFTIWTDEKSVGKAKTLFESQSCCDGVEFKPGIENYNCGGQPWHFGLETKDFQGKTVYHLGYRQFPERQLTLESLEHAKLPMGIDKDRLSSEPSFDFPGAELLDLVVLHGQTICPHNRQTPGFWKFISSIAGELEDEFDEVVFVGNESDREVGTRTYPEWSSFDDGGEFLNLAKFMNQSRLVIGCGSSCVALAGALKIASVRVHDDIGGSSKTIWSNLGEAHVNESESDLRRSWPEFKAKWLSSSGAWIKA